MQPPPDPTPLMHLATGYWPSLTLLTAADLRVFDVLGSAGATAEEVAEARSLHPEAVERLLDACAALEVLRKVGSRYLHTPLSEAWLTSAAPGSMLGALSWSLDQASAWAGLRETIRSGRMQAPPAHLGADRAETRRFVLGMRDRALGVGRALAPLLRVGETGHLLDVGGGPAAYACLLAQLHPHLEVTILDLPEIADIARELVAESPWASRIHVLSGDASEGMYGSEKFDSVLMSGVLHQFGKAAILRMLEGASRALKPCGTLVVCDMMREESGTAPPFSCLFSIQMLLASQEGGVFREAELLEWLDKTGFVVVDTASAPPPLPHRVVTARKRP